VRKIRFNIDEDAWPPNQPNKFMPLVLIHHERQYTVKQSNAIELAKIRPMAFPQSSMIPLLEAMSESEYTNRLEDVTAPLDKCDTNNPQLILVEGSPGIGKSSLLQEISNKWGQGKLLQKFKLVLLVRLRAPCVQQAEYLNDLLQLFCKRDVKSAEISMACTDYLLENGGKDVAFLFDGFDEFPEYLQSDSLIVDILNRQVLPYCGLLVSSRSHASVKLREHATVMVDILGFSRRDQILYIKQSLKENPHQVDEVLDYLIGNPTINCLCCIPFNLKVLMYLYKQGISLPSNSTELYNHFICITICRHLAKSGQTLDNTITDLTNLPEPCNTIVQKLSQLSFEALNENRLIFTIDEVKEACQDILTLPGALNGFGLLQAVRHFELTGETMTFNFIHFSIQEFLAAHYVGLLPSCVELQLLKNTFWSPLHSNMFAMYASITKGQKSAFKEFLSCGNHEIPISEVFLKDQLKCFRLFRCFHEACDEKMCIAIKNAKVFDKKIIDLSETTLCPDDLECIARFLTFVPDIKWKWLSLWACHIQDCGFHVLYRSLVVSGVSIKRLWLQNNNLTHLSSFSISDLVIHCRVEELVINNNDTIAEGHTFFNMLSLPSSILKTLYIGNSELSSEAAATLFNILSENTVLQQLNIGENNITDETCSVIAAAMKKNTSLTQLVLWDRKVSAEAVQNIVRALRHNDTLTELALYDYPCYVKKKIKCLQREVNKARLNRGCRAGFHITF